MHSDLADPPSLIRRHGMGSFVLGASAYAAGWCGVRYFHDVELWIASYWSAFVGVYFMVAGLRNLPTVAFMPEGVTFYGALGNKHSVIIWNDIEIISICKFRGTRWGRYWCLDIVGDWKKPNGKRLTSLLGGY